MLRRRKKIRGSVKYSDVKFSFISSDAITSFLDKFMYDPKDVCLEIGNPSKNDDYVTVDIRKGADYVGDIRSCLTNDYQDDSVISSIPAGSFKVIKIVNTVEHIQWIYQEALFGWLHSLLLDGGMIYIDTPNLEFIVKIYTANLAFFDQGLSLKFPAEEYPGMVVDGKIIDPDENLRKWVNFKLFSGCSPGDYHHCCYDSYWMAKMLSSTGFERISMCSDDTLKVAAFKSGDFSMSQMEAKLKEVLH